MFRPARDGWIGTVSVAKLRWQEIAFLLTIPEPQGATYEQDLGCLGNGHFHNLGPWHRNRCGAVPLTHLPASYLRSGDWDTQILRISANHRWVLIYSWCAWDFAFSGRYPSPYRSSQTTGDKGLIPLCQKPDVCRGIARAARRISAF